MSIAANIRVCRGCEFRDGDACTRSLTVQRYAELAGEGHCPVRKFEHKRRRPRKAPAARPAARKG